MPVVCNDCDIEHRFIGILNWWISMIDSRLDEVSVEIMLFKCTYCNKCRNENGYWEHLSVGDILSQKENTSHCICPKCFKDNFPGEFASLYKEGLIIFKKRVTSDNQVIFEIIYTGNNNEKILGKYYGEQRI
jgi:hypothetical protein